MTKKSVLCLVVVAAALAFACSGADTPSLPGAGGSVGIGGGNGTGGFINSSADGGTSAAASNLQTTGGASATGGRDTIVGSHPTGGAPATGGALANGGSKAATGGTKASGGRTSSAGGATAGGSGAGGSSSAGSPGCNAASQLATGTFKETISGVSRTWMLDVPIGYDKTKPYRLIFVWHPLSGNGSQIVSGGFNGLKSLANNTTIFATADGLSGSNSEASGTGWWNANGGDMQLVQTMMDKINAGLCIDQTRIFTTGFSFGGMMSYTLPFQFDFFRATAPCSGKTGIIPYDNNFSRPVPIMAFHGDQDTFVATALGKAFFDMYATTRNHCATQTKAVDPSPCVEYQGCDVPTTWCLFSGAHQTWDKEPAAIWKFFSKF